MNRFSKFLPIALAVAFFLVGLNVFLASKPSPKAPIYNEIKKYSPYYLEKRFGGLEIRSKLDANFKEKPSNSELFATFEKLEKRWGRDALTIKDNKLLIKSGNKTVEIMIKSKKDLDFIHRYYGVK